MVLTGSIDDRSALFGVLAQVEALGLDLLGIKQILGGPRPTWRIAGGPLCSLVAVLGACLLDELDDVTVSVSGQDAAW
jgi:hypothetical protein